MSRFARGFRGASVNSTGCCSPRQSHFTRLTQHGLTSASTYLFTQCFELIRVYVLPYLLHIIPVGDDAMLEGISDLQETA